MIVAGGGVIYSDASAALDAFARRFGIPVTETQAGKGALPWDHPCSWAPSARPAAAPATPSPATPTWSSPSARRLSDFPTMSWTAWQDPDVGFVAINVAELDAAKAAALPLVGDARVTLEELHAALEARGWSGASPAPARPHRAPAGRVERRGRAGPAPGRGAARLAAGGHPPRQRGGRGPMASSSARPAACPATCTRSGEPAARRLPPGVRLLDDGLRDRRWPGRGHGRARPPRLRHGRRWLLPDARQRDRHGRPGGHRP